MKFMVKLWMICAMMILVIISNAHTAAAYGWGFKKAMDNKPPDVGKYGGIIADHQAVYLDDSGEKVIYFTFDNGYEQGYTNKILDILQQEKVPATFFVTGHYVEDQPELVKRMQKDGHIIGNHSYYHPDFTELTKEKVTKELKSLEEAVAGITEQKSMTFLRPPRGTFNKDTLSWADELGYVHVFWSIAFRDWETDRQRGWEYAYNQIMAQVHPGAIVLLHTVSQDNAEALEKVIKQLKKEGYHFGSLDDLMLKQELPRGWSNFLL